VYQYRGKVARVIDGDTIDVDLDLGFGVWKLKERLRLNGLDAPEMSTDAGKAARAWLLLLLPVGTAAHVETAKFDKYGRYLAEVWLPGTGINLSAALIAAGHAVPWDGSGVRPGTGLPA